MAEQATKIKKKQWYPIIAPPEFDNAALGETFVYEPSAIIGKTVSCSLTSLTNDAHRQNTNIHFKVVEFDGSKANTAIEGYEMMPSSVKRLVRRNSEKIDISFTSETSDNVLLRVKPLIITRGDVKGSIAAKLRKNALNLIDKAIKKITYAEAIGDLISHNIQDAMKASLNKIYPLKVCEIRYAGVEAREKPQEAKPETKA